MTITIQINAPMCDAQAVKEILACRLECMGKVNVLEIKDDGYGRQERII